MTDDIEKQKALIKELRIKAGKAWNEVLKVCNGKIKTPLQILDVQYD